MPTSVKTAYARTTVRPYGRSIRLVHQLFNFYTLGDAACAFYLMAFDATSTFASFTVDVDTVLGR